MAAIAVCIGIAYFIAENSEKNPTKKYKQHNKKKNTYIYSL